MITERRKAILLGNILCLLVTGIVFWAVVPKTTNSIVIAWTFWIGSFISSYGVFQLFTKVWTAPHQYLFFMIIGALAIFIAPPVFGFLYVLGGIGILLNGSKRFLNFLIRYI